MGLRAQAARRHMMAAAIAATPTPDRAIVPSPRPSPATMYGVIYPGSPKRFASNGRRLGDPSAWTTLAATMTGQESEAPTTVEMLEKERP